MVVIMGALEGAEVWKGVRIVCYMLDVGELQAEMAGALTDRRYQIGDVGCRWWPWWAYGVACTTPVMMRAPVCHVCARALIRFFWDGFAIILGKIVYRRSQMHKMQEREEDRFLYRSDLVVFVFTNLGAPRCQTIDFGDFKTPRFLEVDCRLSDAIHRSGIKMPTEEVEVRWHHPIPVEDGDGDGLTNSISISVKFSLWSCLCACGRRGI
ncbi:hypothetical protein KQX54_008651 [Cotesia glomerata]|uniref:Uncharacterized protein n=1 Tax=Cotesia glomerata TaxID=32391 RepID=A0AAV7J446_COTGL|nr:hypothetical protein KQX54_008651 [Cotesia glomerata]